MKCLALLPMLLIIFSSISVIAYNVAYGDNWVLPKSPWGCPPKEDRPNPPAPTIDKDNDGKPDRLYIHLIDENGNDIQEWCLVIIDILVCRGQVASFDPFRRCERGLDCLCKSENPLASLHLLSSRLKLSRLRPFPPPGYARDITRLSARPFWCLSSMSVSPPSCLRWLGGTGRWPPQGRSRQSWLCRQQ